MAQTHLRAIVAAGILLLAAATVSEAGCTKGPKRGSQKIEAQTKMKFNLEFRGGETAEFAMIGDGDTDVDIIVYDQYDRIVARDTGLSDLGLVRWTPPQTQTYRIEIVNLGNVWNMVRFGYN